jgi:hypothetical protein
VAIHYFLVKFLSFQQEKAIVSMASCGRYRPTQWRCINSGHCRLPISSSASQKWPSLTVFCNNPLTIHRSIFMSTKYEDSDSKFNVRESDRGDTHRVQHDRYDKTSADESSGHTDHSYYYHDVNTSTGETRHGEGDKPAGSRRNRD